MESLDLPRRQRSIFLAGPTFNLLPDDATATRALERIRDHLDVGGSALVPLFIPTPTSDEVLGKPRTATEPDGSTISVTATAEERDDAARVQRTTLRYERVTAGRRTTVDRPWVLHWHTQDGFRALAASVGHAPYAREVGSADYEQAGLYDPSQPGAADRLKLLRLLAEEGASIEEMKEAAVEDRLIGLAVDAVVRPAGPRLTLREVCSRSGVELDSAKALLRAAGFVHPGDDIAVFTEDDVRCLGFLSLMAFLGEGNPGMQITRVAGAAMSALAEAELAAVRSSYEGALRSVGAGEFEQAQSFRALATMLPEVLHVLDVFHRRHLLAGLRARVLWDGGRPNTEAAIGFADAVGYTERSQAADANSLAIMVEQFEATARDVVSDCGGRLVKLIGDEVMFQAATAEGGCRIASGLVQTFRADPQLPDVRVGLAYGQVLSFEGDYYGPAVNEAARLVAAAEPNAVLATTGVRSAASDAFGFTTRGQLELKGIGLVEAFSLEPVD